MASSTVGWFDMSGPSTTTACVVGTAIAAPTTHHHHGTVRRSWNIARLPGVAANEAVFGFGTTGSLASRDRQRWRAAARPTPAHATRRPRRCHATAAGCGRAARRRQPGTALRPLLRLWRRPGRWAAHDLHGR